MKNLTKYISHMKDLHSLNEYLNEKLIIFPSQVDEKLVINKDFGGNLASLDEIYNFDWTYYDRHRPSAGIYYADKDIKAFDVFYKYFVQCAKQKITFHQQCRLANKGEYLFAVNESEKKIYLFHRHMNLNAHQPTLYEKFEIIPSSNGMRIHFIQMVPRIGIYPLSIKSTFTVKGTNPPQYYLIDEELWKEMKTLYNDLKNR